MGNLMNFSQGRVSDASAPLNNAIGDFTKQLSDRAAKAEEKKRYDAKIARQNKQDVRAKILADRQDVEYNRKIGNRQIVADYTGNFNSAAALSDTTRGAADKALLASVNLGNDKYRDIGEDDAYKLQAAYERGTVFKEDVNSTVLSDLLAQGIDPVTAKATASAIAGGYSSKADLNKINQEAATATNKLLQDRYDNAIKLKKLEVSNNKNGSTKSTRRSGSYSKARYSNKAGVGGLMKLIDKERVGNTDYKEMEGVLSKVLGTKLPDGSPITAQMYADAFPLMNDDSGPLNSVNWFPSFMTDNDVVDKPSEITRIIAINEKSKLSDELSYGKGYSKNNYNKVDLSNLPKVNYVKSKDVGVQARANLLGDINDILKGVKPASKSNSSVTNKPAVNDLLGDKQLTTDVNGMFNVKDTAIDNDSKFFNSPEADKYIQSQRDDYAELMKDDGYEQLTPSADMATAIKEFTGKSRVSAQVNGINKILANQTVNDTLLQPTDVLSTGDMNSIVSSKKEASRINSLLANQGIMEKVDQAIVTRDLTADDARVEAIDRDMLIANAKAAQEQRVRREQVLRDAEATRINNAGKQNSKIISYYTRMYNETKDPKYAQILGKYIRNNSK